MTYRSDRQSASANPKSSGHLMENWREQKFWGKALTIFLILAILASVGGIVYLNLTGKGQNYSEFYILDAEGKAIKYPSDMKLGDSANVRIGVVNHEYRTMSYDITISDNETIINRIGPINLANKEMWENTVGFKPVISGDNQKIEFLLYKRENGSTDNSTPLALSLWVNVR